MIKRLIIAGMGSLGESLIYFLQEHYEIIAIDSLSHRVQSLRSQYDIQCILGSVLDINLLSTLDLKESCAFISVTEKDSVNLAACRYVKQQFPLKFVAARLKDLDVYLLAKTTSLQESIHLLFNPEYEGITHALQVLRYPNVMRHISLFEKKLYGLVVKVESRHRICGMNLHDIEHHRTLKDTKIIQIFRQNTLCISPKNLILQEGDRVCVVYHSMAGVKRFFDVTMEIPEFLVYFGINSFAYALAKMVSPHEFKKIFFIDEDPVQYEPLAMLYPELSFYKGSPLDKNLWNDLGIQAKKSGVLALGLKDADNILAALVHTHAHHVVTMVQNAPYLAIGLQMGVKSIIHPNFLILEHVMTHLSPACIERIYILTDLLSENQELTLLVTAELMEDSPILQVRPIELNAMNIKIIAVLRKSKVLFNPDSVFKEDHVVFLCPQSHYTQLLNVLVL
ncbi:NAD-binding protein [Holospora curviuscula]|uniref:Trk system potassium uptake protein TrkA n=1 Tax=Holospora curviuscula TaxID=1082868 RepID=A0A2S5R7C0_9PROT|nr:NAD-binding protein [Holospora curviuscula]PPE03204.1 Trk system potassium uptake protein TrkA [Holospora curviuscula]